jgi:hypothetical protein
VKIDCKEKRRWKMGFYDNRENALFRTLQEQVITFKQWGASIAEKHGEWETNYLYWDKLYNAVEGVLEHTSLAEWQTEVYELILYTLARDNEVENVLQLLIVQPKIFLSLAYSAITYSDYEARWQIAYGLGEVKGMRDEVNSLLSKLSNDEHEYVRRRALIALQKKWKDELNDQEVNSAVPPV